MVDLTKQYDEIGEDYVEKQQDHYDEHTDWPRPFLVENLGFNGKTVLDLGCGHGADLQRYSSLGAEGYGVDIAREGDDVVLDDVRG